MARGPCAQAGSAHPVAKTRKAKSAGSSGRRQGMTHLSRAAPWGIYLHRIPKTAQSVASAENKARIRGIGGGSVAVKATNRDLRAAILRLLLAGKCRRPRQCLRPLET